MTTKKASVKDLAAKAAAAKKANEKKEAAPKKEAAKKAASAKKEAPKAAEKKVAAPKKAVAPKKAAAPKKEVAKKVAAPKKAAAKQTVTVTVQYQGFDVTTEEVVAKVLEVAGKKSAKEVNVYYQPETRVAYYTIDGESGEVNL